MKILITTTAFYPENSPRSIRATELAKGFALAGNEVTVVAPLKSKTVELAQKFGFELKDLGPMRFKYIKLPEKGGLKRNIIRVVSRVLNLLVEYPEIGWYFNVKNALKNERGYDLLVSIAVPYPVHWGVASIHNQRNKIAKTWVADCGDPFYGLKNDSFKKMFYFKYIEKNFCRKADFITIPLEEARDCYFSEFHSKIKVIPQGFYFPNSIESKEVIFNPKIVFAYTGNIRSYMHYAIPFLRLLSKTRYDFEFLLLTEDSVIFSELENFIPSKYQVLPYLDREEMYKLLANVNFFIHFPYLKEGQQSLKLVDYYFMGKPIFSYNDTNKAELIFEEFMNGDFTNSYELQNPEKYRIENVVKQFLELV